MHGKAFVLSIFLFLLIHLENSHAFIWNAALNSSQRCTEGRIMLCGTDIPEALSFLCGGRYNGVLEKRRYESEPDNTLSINENYRRLFVPKRTAIASLKPHKRRGPAAECCSKPCCLRELYAYCEDRDIYWSFG